MPNWSPNWHDVKWNSNEAQASAGELRRMADALERAADERGRLAATALDGWLGAHRERFEQDLTRGLADMRSLAGVCREAAQEIDLADRKAQEEQQRREREREEWEHEAERERRARNP